MKLKLCLYSLCGFLIIGLAHAQIRRTTKMPDFFVPQGALSTTPKTEKLPPIEAMRFNGQQAPVVLEMQQKQQAQAPHPQTAETIVYERAKLKNTNPQPHADSTANTDLSKQNPMPKPAQHPISDPAEIAVMPTPETYKTEPKIIVSEPAAETNITAFDRIIADYKHDREAISRGQNINNQRLNNMIADFQDLEHEI